MSRLVSPLFLLALLALVIAPTLDVATGQEKKPEPKDKATTIDYETLVNDRLGKGITPEKNAVVLLWKALGPTPEGGKGMPAEFFSRLGMAEPPKNGDYFIGLHAFMTDHLKAERAEFMGIYDQQGWATRHPWEPKTYPPIAAWLKANEKPLALVMEATKRPDYYSPLISRRDPKDQGMLIGALLPAVQKCRELAAALTARAMLRTWEGKSDLAWQDLLACHRLARLVARGGTLIESLVGIAIDQVANNADLAYLESAKLTSQQVLSCLKDLQSLPPMPPMWDKLDVLERSTYLQSLQMVRTGGMRTLEGLSGGPGKKPTEEELNALASIDWEPAVKNGNKWYDRMVAAMRLPDRVAREKELDRIEMDLKAMKKDVVEPGSLLKPLLGKGQPDKMVAKAISDVLITLLLPAVRKVQGAHDRSVQFERLGHVAFALAAYERDQGRYPAKLTDLSPKYLTTIPDDLFSGKPLIYRPAEKGYLLYSVGVNGKDDGGHWVDDDPPGDDPRVRMPLPPLKKK